MTTETKWTPREEGLRAAQLEPEGRRNKREGERHDNNTKDPAERRASHDRAVVRKPEGRSTPTGAAHGPRRRGNKSNATPAANARAGRGIELLSAVRDRWVRARPRSPGMGAAGAPSPPDDDARTAGEAQVAPPSPDGSPASTSSKFIAGPPHPASFPVDRNVVAATGTARSSREQTLTSPPLVTHFPPEQRPGLGASSGPADPFGSDVTTTSGAWTEAAFRRGSSHWPSSATLSLRYLGPRRRQRRKSDGGTLSRRRPVHGSEHWTTTRPSGGGSLRAVSPRGFFGDHDNFPEHFSNDTRTERRRFYGVSQKNGTPLEGRRCRSPGCIRTPSD